MISPEPKHSPLHLPPDPLLPRPSRRPRRPRRTAERWVQDLSVAGRWRQRLQGGPVQVNLPRIQRLPPPVPRLRADRGGREPGRHLHVPSSPLVSVLHTVCV